MTRCNPWCVHSAFFSPGAGLSERAWPRRRQKLTGDSGLNRWWRSKANLRRFLQEFLLTNSFWRIMGCIPFIPFFQFSACIYESRREVINLCFCLIAFCPGGEECLFGIFGYGFRVLFPFLCCSASFCWNRPRSADSNSECCSPRDFCCRTPVRRSEACSSIRRCFSTSSRQSLSSSSA